jgi:hypothetical protein
MSRLASLKPLTIPLLAAGAAIAVFSLVVAGRREAPAARVTYGGKLDAKNKATLSRAVEMQGKAAESRPRRPVLPIAFWDIAELDVDEQRPASSESYAVDNDDSSGARWLARATQSPDGDEFDDLDDPAEVAADSMSMISEASRAAAGLDPSDVDEASEEDRA